MADQITFDEWSKLEMKIGEIIAVEKVPERDKLYKFQVDVGEEKPRQIISSIVPYYTEEELLHKRIVVLTNLAPAKFAGQISEGMLLGPEDGEGNFVLLTVDKDIKIGSIVR